MGVTNSHCKTWTEFSKWKTPAVNLGQAIRQWVEAVIQWIWVSRAESTLGTMLHFKIRQKTTGLCRFSAQNLWNLTCVELSLNIYLQNKLEFQTCSFEYNSFSTFLPQKSAEWSDEARIMIILFRWYGKRQCLSRLGCLCESLTY